MGMFLIVFLLYPVWMWLRTESAARLDRIVVPVNRRRTR